MGEYYFLNLEKLWDFKKFPSRPITKPTNRLPIPGSPPPFLAKLSRPPTTAIVEKCHPPFMKEGGGGGGGQGKGGWDYEVIKQLRVKINVSIHGNTRYTYIPGFNNLLTTVTNFPKMTMLKAK